MTQTTKTLLRFLMTAAAAFGLIFMLNARGVYALSPEDPEVIPVGEGDDISSYFNDLTFAEGEQALPVTIDPGDGTVYFEEKEEDDGTGYNERDRIIDIYNISAKDFREMTRGSAEENRKVILNFLLSDPCIVHEQDDGTLKAEYPFAGKILFVILEEGQLGSTYGAVHAAYERERGRYILQYGSQEDTADAYVKLCTDYGQENVLINLLGTLSDIKYDEAAGDQTYSSFTTAKSRSWGVDTMHMDSLRDWMNENHVGKTLKVAVIDTGLRVDEVNEKIIDGYGIDKSRIIESDCTHITSSVYSYTALNDQSDTGWKPQKCSYADVKGHGTLVTSIIQDGTSSEVKEFCIRDSGYHYKEYNSKRYALIDINGMISSVLRAGLSGAKVVNMSQGISCYDPSSGKYKAYSGVGIDSMADVTKATLDYYNNELGRIIDQYDLCVVAASGNDGRDSSEYMFFPCSNPSVIQVNNLTYTTEGWVLASNSNYGKNTSFAAPGTRIVGGWYDWEAHKACYASKSGTSLSAPHITAALANLRLYNPELDHKQAVDLLKEYCADLGTAGWDNKFGYGFPTFKKWYKAAFISDSSVCGTQTLPMGMKVSLPDNPEKYGYSFGGWFTDEACTQGYDFNTPVKDNVILYAKWSRMQRIIRFHYNDAGDTYEDVNVWYGDYVNEPAEPERFGYEFVGWYGDKELTLPFDFSMRVEDYHHVYAKWEKVQYANPLTVTGKTVKVRYSALKKKSKVFKRSKVIKLGSPIPKITYKLYSAKKGKKNFKKYFKVAKTSGKVTVRKGLKKGKYRVTVKVKSSGDEDYLPKTKKVTFRVRVK